MPTSIITLWLNIVASLFLIASDSIPKTYITGIVTVIMFLCCFILLPIKEKYLRLDVDEKNAKEDKEKEENEEKEPIIQPLIQTV